MCQHHATECRNFTAFRHRWEMPMIWLSAIITLFGFLFGIAAVVVNTDGTALGLGDDAKETLDTLSLLALLPLIPIAFYIYRFYLAAQAKSNALRIGPAQFPKLFALYQDIGRRLELKTLPKLYLTNGNGVVNAFALECNRRQRYVVIHAEIAMLMPTAPEIVEFVLAHELAHHKLRHVSLWRLAIGVVPQSLVLPGLATTRAQEYSADRVALAVCPNYANTVRLLAVGPWMQHGVNPQAWLEQCEEENKELFVRISNLLSDHAVMVKRFKALKDIEMHGFERHGSMF
ncbi:M48 family metallopeptidase [Serratia ureilytica]|uniref:M48 family metallopeptidase n=1 Tax=Serratia ureilytica TaxID=300181 RepID=UPI00313DAD77